MTIKEPPNLSLVDMILNKMFSDLKKEFDEPTISNLHELYKMGELDDHKKITNTLKNITGEDLETN